MDAVIETQKAVFNVLTGDAELLAMVKSIYNFVPVGAKYPYVTIGQGLAKGFSSLNSRGFEVDLDITAYSQATTQKEALEITERIFQLLNQQNLVIDNFNFICASFTNSKTMRLSNGDISGTVSFKILLKNE